MKKMLFKISGTITIVKNEYKKVKSWEKRYISVHCHFRYM
jgi:hypothetical protein